MKTFIKDKVYHIVYDSVGDFFKNTDLKNPPATMHSCNKYQHNDIAKDTSSSWRYADDGSRSKYYDLRFDGSKGKNMCAEEVKKTMADKSYKSLIRQARTYRKRINYEDRGFRLNVSKAISGEDKYFGVYKNTKKPTVKIAINICGSACVDASSFRKIAATAVPSIYALEQAGIATEVWFTAFASGTHETDEIKYTVTEVLLKSAQQRFNWTTFAPVFTLASYRESIFLSWIYSEYEVHEGLGRPMSDSTIKENDSFGYTSIIGLNAVGPVSNVTSIFEKLHKTKL